MSNHRPYEFMVKHTPQKEWVAGPGILIAFAFFLGGISGGLYLVSLYFNNMPGMFIGWLLAILMGGLDMVHLSKRRRFWRMFLRPQTSWLARGFIFVMLFIGFAAIQLALFSWLPGTATETIFKVLAGITAFAVTIHSGFVVSYVSAVKFWDSAIIPVLSVISGMLGGLAILLAVSLGGDYAQIALLQNILRVALVVYTLTIAIYLLSTAYAGSVAKSSVIWIVRGSMAPVFWVGVISMGVIIPLAILLSTWISSALIIISSSAIPNSSGFTFKVIGANRRGLKENSSDPRSFHFNKPKVMNKILMPSSSSADFPFLIKFLMRD